MVYGYVVELRWDTVCMDCAVLLAVAWLLIETAVLGMAPSACMGRGVMTAQIYTGPEPSCGVIRPSSDHKGERRARLLGLRTSRTPYRAVHQRHVAGCPS